MDISDIKKIENHPDYHSLVKRRGRLSWGLSLFACTMLLGFIAGAIWAPELYATPLAADGVFSVGMLAGMTLIIGCVLLTWFFLHRCTTDFEMVQRQLAEYLRHD